MFCGSEGYRCEPPGKRGSTCHVKDKHLICFALVRMHQFTSPEEGKWHLQLPPGKVHRNQDPIRLNTTPTDGEFEVSVAPAAALNVSSLPSAPESSRVLLILTSSVTFKDNQASVAHGVQLTGVGFHPNFGMTMLVNRP